jgi:UDPglucose 6-dehydrogenase
MKIVVVGLGYVGLSNLALLSTKHQVVGVDIDQDKIDYLNQGKLYIKEALLKKYLDKFSWTVTTDLAFACINADFVLVSTPTDYDQKKGNFNTSSIEQVIQNVRDINPLTKFIIRSTVPIGFTRSLREKFKYENIYFMPEFLREGTALYDSLNPDRIIFGEKSSIANQFIDQYKKCILVKNSSIHFTNSDEAEAIKLFSNTYLAMRVAFFNELDNFSIAKKLSTKAIINGIGLDVRIGNYYNNPSFGFGGYCLPKDVAQLQKQFGKVPQSLIAATLQSNLKRKQFIAGQVINLNPKVLGVYKISMKANSDNSRSSSILDIIRMVSEKNIRVLVYEPNLDINDKYFEVCNNLDVFKARCDLIITNRFDDVIKDVAEKVFTRDLFGCD